MAPQRSYQMQQYLDAPAHEHPYFKPEGVAARKKRLISELDRDLTEIQFAALTSSKAESGRALSQELLRIFDVPLYLPGKKSKKCSKTLIAEMDAILTSLTQSQAVPQRGEGDVDEDLA